MASRSKEPGTPDRRPQRKRDARGRIAAFVPNESQREMVKTLHAVGMPHATIAKGIGIDQQTLAKHFRDELDHAAAEADAKVAGTMFRIATDLTHKDVQRAAQFWLQARAKWRTQSEINFAAGDPDGSPDPNDVQATQITLRFRSDRPKGLPGAPPEDQ